ncbi:hypothetical protein [Bacillus sp. Hm123]|uniref:hypothetical protein n=1 Tax=Bacillus sp. Hm123 TaxID=3450745 RepID=UPI003F43235B
MANTFSKTRLYSPSAIGDILRIARERSCQEERRTKRYMAKALGITVDRLTRMEEGTSQVPYDLAVEWCNIVNDQTALKQINHIYGMTLPPTDPRLLLSVPDQLNNFIRQAKRAIEAAKALKDISRNRRPGRPFSEHDERSILNLSEEILDVQQSSECVIGSMEENWGLCKDTLHRNWITEAISDHVIIHSVTQFEEIRKEQFFEARARGWKA